MDYEAGAKFRLEPCGLRRHDVAGVGNVDELVHRDRIEGKGHLHLTGVDAALKFVETADTTYEVDSFVGAEVSDTEDIAQDEVGTYGHVEHADRILVIVGALLGSQRVPLFAEVEGEVVESGRLIDFFALLLYDKVLSKAVKEFLLGQTV